MTVIEKILKDLEMAHAVQMSAGRKVSEHLKAALAEVVGTPAVKPEMVVTVKPKAKAKAKAPKATTWPVRCTVGATFEYTRTSKTSKSKGKTFLYTVTAVDKNGKPASWTKVAA